MSDVKLASPWWVNLCGLVPVLIYFFFRNRRPHLSGKQLLFISLFGVAFGFVEAAVVIYLRSAAGLIDANKLAKGWSTTEQSELLSSLPLELLSIELLREVATIIMLGSIAFLFSTGMKERLALFLWTFATWDIFYYIFLRLTISWPTSWLSGDVLFLIPVPWQAQVWFPLLVSLLTIISISITRQKTRKSKTPLS